MISTEKPGTPKELVHYGVKGMKWGVRKDRFTSASTKEFNRKFPTSEARKNEIIRARASLAKQNIDFLASPSETQRRKMREAFYRDPDRATALRLTRGEKVVLGLLAATTGPIGVGVGTGVALRVAQRHSIEEWQRRQKNQKS